MTQTDKTKTQDRPAEAAHALLGASSASKWLNCPPSAREEEREPDSGSEFAREGTLAHAIGARKIKNELRARGLGDKAFPDVADTRSEDAEIAELWEDYHTGEMEEYTDGYCAYVIDRFLEHLARDPQAVIQIEKRLDFSTYVPEGFGTGDAAIVSEGMIEVIDLKYGKGVEVKAENNPQMKLYALGCSGEWMFDYAVDRVRMTIYQPRIGNLSTWETSRRELVEWGLFEVKPLATLAYHGKGWKRAGRWCRFCKVAARCTALAERNLSMLDLGDADRIDTATMATHVLPRLPELTAWIDKVKEITLADALAGRDFPGWKLVRGRSVRKISDQEAMLAALVEGTDIKAEELLRPRELRTITDLEKLIGKKRFAEIGKEWIIKPEGKPTLVEASDRREAISPGDDFKGMTG